MIASFQQRMAQLFKHDKWSECVPVLDYSHHEEIFVTEGPYIGFSFVCQPTPGCNEDIRNTLTNLYNHDMPKDTLMQFSLVSLPDVNTFIRGYDTIRGGRMSGEDGSLSDTMSQSVIEYLREGTRNPIHRSGLKIRNFECWVSVKIPIKKQLPTDKEVEIALKIRDEVENALSSVSLVPARMTDEMWLHRMNILINHSEDASWRSEPVKRNHGRSLRAQLLEPGSMVKQTPDGIEFYSEGKSEPDAVATMLSLKRYPDYIMYGQMLDLVGDWREGENGIYDNFMITLNIEFPDQIKAKKRFQKGRNWLTHQSHGPLIKWVDSLRFQKQDYDAINHELEEEGAKLVRAYLQFTLFSRTRKDAEKNVATMKAHYAKKKFNIVEDRNFSAPLFLSSLPFGIDKSASMHFERYDTFTTNSLVFLTPHMASWKGNTPTPVIELIGRDGQLFGLDLFKTDGNFNAVISAASGSGKSFLVNKLVASYLGSGIKTGGTSAPGNQPIDDGAQVFIVDVGRSYEGLCSQYEGSQFLEFGAGMSYSLNPFPAIHDWYGKEGQANMVLNLVKSMASESGTINDFQSSEMLNLLTELWENKKNDATITMFADMCRTHPHEEMKRIAAQLKPFCDGGVYQNFFGDNLPPVEFNGRLIVCELEELKAIPHVQQCVLMAIINNAQHAMYLSGTSRKKIFILDEAWEYLGDGDGQSNFFAKFLETGWRRFRKTRAAGICITQSMLDAYQSAAGVAIVNNSAWKIMLRQEPETIEKLKDEKAFDGSPLDFDLLKSVKTKKHEYSELFVRLGSAREIVRLFVDKRSQLVFSTDPDDKEAIAAYRKQGLSMGEAIDAVHNDRHAGQKVA
ncbi:TraC family protein [Neiella marina]|uniref:TraC family protein n=1 Tax=Neiella holothuriorum TaxID=2870530 RepID=A0ABS7EGA1_9GAMM|nr:TraC family protein [Neiella holothuriorum]MBW8191367.1 TraC family protein [Neiella holothuriorum]